MRKFEEGSGPLFSCAIGLTRTTYKLDAVEKEEAMNKNLGDIMRAKGAATRQRIFDYFTQHPWNTQADCARDLGLTKNTVSKHVKDLKKSTTKTRK